MPSATKIALTIVSQFHAHENDAAELAKNIVTDLSNFEIISIHRYTKFDDAFKIELESHYDAAVMGNLSEYAIQISQKLVTPWLVYYDEDCKQIELIYNDSSTTQKRKEIYHQIRWAHWQIAFID